MHAVYLASLFGGALATMLFAILGWVGGGHAGGHAHVHAGHGAHGHSGSDHSASGHGVHGHAPVGQNHAAASGHGHSQDGSTRAAQTGAGAVAQHGALSASVGWALTWMSPLALAGAAVWFGAAGLIAEGAIGSLALIAAIIAAVIGALLVRSVMAAFLRASTPPLQLTGEGAIGTVNAAIRTDGVGEVVYTLEGLHRSMPARSVDGMPIPRGVAVVIVRRERGIAWVSPLDPLSALQPDAPLPLGSGSSREVRADGRAADSLDPDGVPRENRP